MGSLLTFNLLLQGDEAREGALRALAKPGGATGASDADAHRGCQEPAQPPGARRERGPAEPLVPADGSLRPARAQRGLLFLLWSRGERHLGAAPQRLDNTGVRGQGEDMRLMVKVFGERSDRKGTKQIHCSFYLVSSRGWLLVKKHKNSVIQGKDCTFFLTELCETDSLFAVHTLCCRSEDEYYPKVLTVILINSWFIKLQVSTPKLVAGLLQISLKNKRCHFSFGATLTKFNTCLTCLDI